MPLGSFLGIVLGSAGAFLGGTSLRTERVKAVAGAALGLIGIVLALWAGNF